MLRLVTFVLIAGALIGCSNGVVRKSERYVEFSFETAPGRPAEQLPPITIRTSDGEFKLDDRAMTAVNELAVVRARTCRQFSPSEDRSYSLDFINREALAKCYRDLQSAEIGGRKMTTYEIEALLDWISLWTVCV